MGLDMNAFTTSKKFDGIISNEEAPDDSTVIFYWRKHPNLHGWMENLYRKKGGEEPEFNCIGVVLESKDIDDLEADIIAARLPHTTGFFFGESDGSEVSDDLKFIELARSALRGGLTVYYSAWY